jgi:hypothetical protein
VFEFFFELDPDMPEKTPGCVAEQDQLLDEIEQDEIELIGERQPWKRVIRIQEYFN